jgi:hypothetical protein
MAVTTDEIKSFIQRLMRRELEAGELADLTTRDLGDINAYLAAHTQTDLAAYDDTPDRFKPDGLPGLSEPGTITTAKRTYTEAEILAEFGVLD